MQRERLSEETRCTTRVSFAPTRVTYAGDRHSILLHLMGTGVTWQGILGTKPSTGKPRARLNRLIGLAYQVGCLIWNNFNSIEPIR